MTTRWLRFSDLKESGIVKNRVQLKRLIEKYGFPPGRMISPNNRAWTDDEIAAYYASCPVQGPELRGAAKKYSDYRKAKAENTDATTTDAS